MGSTIRLWGGVAFMLTLLALSGCGEPGKTNVNGTMLTSIVVTAPSSSLPAAASQQYRAIGAYSDHTTKDLTQAVAWTSSDAGKASISATGMVTALTEGTTTITAALGSVEGSAVLNVSKQGATLQWITVKPEAATILVNGTRQFTAIGTYSDYTSQDITGSVTWGVADSGIAAITTNGLATGLAEGSTDITATLGSVSDTSWLTVALHLQPLVINIPSVPATTTDVDYGLELQASGGAYPYTWSISGVLPQGLVLAPEGLIWGTPTWPGTYTFDVTVTDSMNNTATSTLTIQVDQSTRLIPPADAAPDAFKYGNYFFDAEGNVTIAGTVGDPLNYDAPVIFLSKYDADWNRLWGVIAIDTSSANNLTGSGMDKDGNIFITGSTQCDLLTNDCDLSTLRHIFLAKYDPSGKRLWLWQERSGDWSPHGVSIDSDGNSYIAWMYGYTMNVAKFDPAGTMLWQYQSNVDLVGDLQTCMSRPWAGVYSLTIDHAGAAYVLAYLNPHDLVGSTLEGQVGWFVLKVDANGTKAWAVSEPDFTNMTYLNYQLLTAANGDLFAVANNDNGTMLVKFDADGNTLWTKNPFGDGASYPAFRTGAIVDSNGNFFVIGEAMGSLDGQPYQGGWQDVFIAKVDAQGNKLWTVEMGTTDYDYPNTVAADPAGNAYFWAMSSLYKFDPSGTLLWTK